MDYNSGLLTCLIMIVLLTFLDTLASTIEEGKAASKSPHLKFGYFFLCPGKQFLLLSFKFS
jgi:hypothetical protein